MSQFLQSLRRRPWFAKTYVTILVVVPLTATLFALSAYSWYQGRPQDLVLFFTLYVLTAFGVTIGFHRLLTHRSFDCVGPVKAVLLVLGCMAIEGNPLWWAATHIKHHANADRDDDPHSPMQGLWHAHIGWLMKMDRYADPRVYVPHLFRDRVVMAVDRTYLLWYGASLLLPFLIGGWRGLLWGGFVRIFFAHHVTWSVNSICHMFGSRPYMTGDTSANNWIVGLLAFGEGWHNNHHAFPQSAYHGLRAWQIDLSAYVIRLMKRLRLVWNVHMPSEAMRALKAQAPVPDSVIQPLSAEA